MEEQWKDIVIEKNGVVYDYRGLYQVSNMGRVRNVKTCRIMKLTKNKQGYLLVALSRNGKQKNFYIHRLVASAFIPNPNNLPLINHRNEFDKDDNRVENLEWCDCKYNLNYGTAMKRRVEKQIGRKASEETKRKCSEWQMGRTLSDKHRKNIGKATKGENNPKARKVICLETSQIFGCIKDASKWCNGNVGQCCAGKSKTAGGYHWMYYEDYLAQKSDTI